MPETQLSPVPAVNWPFRWSVLLAMITFPLIWVGGLVTTTDAGMAVPDWPNTYGYNLFLYPYSTWLFGPWDLFIEHGHRLLGSLAGLVAIILVVSTFRHTSQKSLRWLAVGALVLVVSQGILGGVRVLAIDRFLAKVHGCVGPAFFAYTAAFATICYRKLGTNKSVSSGWPIKTGSMTLSIALLISSFLQLVLGANLRHIEETASFHLFRWLVLTHLIFAGLVFLLSIAMWISRARDSRRGTASPSKRTAQFVVIMVLCQIALGVCTWIVKYHWPFDSDRVTFFANFLIMEKSLWQTSIVTAHVALGSLILMTSAVLSAQLFMETNPSLVDHEPNSESTPSGAVA